MRTALTITAAAVIMAGCATTQHLNPFVSHPFSKMDTNGDGVVSKSEAKADPQIAKEFNRIDTSGDGVIDTKEYRAATTWLAPKPKFKNFDTNGDGFISKQEADAVGGGLDRHFGQIDADGDDNISHAEFRAATLNPTRGVKFNQLDTDHDGAIDKKEASKAPLLETNFSRIDVNGDGLISKSEFKAAGRR